MHLVESGIHKILYDIIKVFFHYVFVNQLQNKKKMLKGQTCSFCIEVAPKHYYYQSFML